VSNDLLLANLIMLVLAVTFGAAYVVMLRGSSPYPPRVNEYLAARDEHPQQR
jgi:hypothetical protein